MVIAAAETTVPNEILSHIDGSKVFALQSNEASAGRTIVISTPYSRVQH